MAATEGFLYLIESNSPPGEFFIAPTPDCSSRLISIKIRLNMPTYHTSPDGLNLKDTWLAVGSFDGVHLGHRDLIRQLVDGSQADKCQSVVMTLFPHPSRVVRNLTTPIYLSSFEERVALLEQSGVDHIIRLPFDKKTANQSAATFMNRMVYTLGVKHLLVGQNFALGHDRKGNVEELSHLGHALGYQLTAIPPFTVDGFAISSSQIRAWLGEGDVDMAARALGRPYRICGHVVHGDERGGRIGIPTCNLAAWQEQVLPAGGVYACRVDIDGQKLGAVTNIGLRPTFHSEHPRVTVETHLFDYSGNLYDSQLCLDFIQRIRGEQRFESADALVKQIQLDISHARRLLA
jgi:riboflavin kinase/FMN adenylyltransferase